MGDHLADSLRNHLRILALKKAALVLMALADKMSKDNFPVRLETLSLVTPVSEAVEILEAIADREK